MRDNHIFQWSTIFIHGKILDFIDNIFTRDYTTEDNMFSRRNRPKSRIKMYLCHSPVKMRGVSCCTRKTIMFYSYLNRKQMAYIKNCDPLVFGPRLAIESKYGRSCFIWKFSSKSNFSFKEKDQNHSILLPENVPP